MPPDEGCVAGTAPDIDDGIVVVDACDEEQDRPPVWSTTNDVMMARSATVVSCATRRGLC